jgi:pimeloyl-ACP methyl ester carboxylesterase|tara:strand:+ start:601 stop:1374 length:774 start_codon:yes stop_codon:yes gene_type:complete
VTSSAVDCHYSIIGSGPPLFLTHGIGAAEDAWRFMLPKLSKHFTVVTYDLRGHGKSPVTHKNFTLDELVFDLERIRKKTKFEKAHFAGHSLGGMIAPAYALKFPKHTISVGLLSTVAGRSEEDSKKVWNVIYEMEKNGIEKTLQTLTDRWFTDEFIKNNPELVQRRLKQVVDTDPEVFLNVFKIYAKTEMLPWLKNISKRCLLLTGENDSGCSPKHNEIMANEIKYSKLVILPKYKHSFLIEAPNEVAENLIEFINE